MTPLIDGSMSMSAMPYENLGDALATDYFYVREEFTEEQWQHFLATRRFVDTEVLPAINQYWEAAELPWPLMRRLPELRLLGEDIAGYGCPGMTPLARGLVNMELHRGDGSLARLVVADARDLLGGNGLLLEKHIIRHMGDIEVIHTYEGTETMQTLIVGRDITGVGAFT